MIQERVAAHERKTRADKERRPKAVYSGVVFLSTEETHVEKLKTTALNFFACTSLQRGLHLGLKLEVELGSVGKAEGPLKSPAFRSMSTGTCPIFGLGTACTDPQGREPQVDHRQKRRMESVALCALGKSWFPLNRAGPQKKNRSSG